MRDGLATVGILLVGGATVALAGSVILRAPVYANLDGSTPTMLGMSLGITVLALGIGLGGAWLAWRAGLKYASTFLGILGVLWIILGWQAVDAANVVFDESTPRVQEVQFVRSFVSGSKTKTRYVVVTPWSGIEADEVTLTLHLSSQYFEPGRALLVTIHEGALGRAYATDLQPVAP